MGKLDIASILQGVSKNVDPFKFKLSIAYCIILNTLISLNYNGRVKAQGFYSWDK